MKANNAKRSKIIGIIMTYNCAPMLKNVFEQIPKQVFDEIIAVDDRSTDGSAEVAKKLKINVFSHKHLGYGGNIKYGLKIALEKGADYMVEIHGDGQYDPKYILPALKKMQLGYDFLLGSRFTNLKQALKDKMPIVRYVANLGLSFIDRIVLQLPLTEFHTGFRVYSRKLIEKAGFENTSDDYLYSFEIIAQAKFHNLNVCEMPIRCDYSKQHTSVSIKKAAVYSFETFGVLAQYLLAKTGIKTGVFK